MAPATAQWLRHVHKQASDKLAKDSGNYTAQYAAELATLHRDPCRASGLVRREPPLGPRTRRRLFDRSLVGDVLRTARPSLDVGPQPRGQRAGADHQSAGCGREAAAVFFCRRAVFLSAAVGRPDRSAGLGTGPGVAGLAVRVPAVAAVGSGHFRHAHPLWLGHARIREVAPFRLSSAPPRRPRVSDLPCREP